MYVEDKVSAQGPIAVRVSPDQTVAQLKAQIETEFDIPAAVQKWILGKSLAADETVTLGSRGVTKDGAGIFLYLVSPGQCGFDSVRLLHFTECTEVTLAFLNCIVYFFVLKLHCSLYCT